MHVTRGSAPRRRAAARVSRRFVSCGAPEDIEFRPTARHFGITTQPTCQAQAPTRLPRAQRATRAGAGVALLARDGRRPTISSSKAEHLSATDCGWRRKAIRRAQTRWQRRWQGSRRTPRSHSQRANKHHAGRETNACSEPCGLGRRGIARTRRCALLSSAKLVSRGRRSFPLAGVPPRRPEAWGFALLSPSSAACVAVGQRPGPPHKRAPRERALQALRCRARSWGSDRLRCFLGVCFDVTLLALTQADTPG